MRAGILDTIPASSLDGLTAEDFRLLLNGSGEVNIHQLIGYTSFNDESGGAGSEKLLKFKKWFWSILEKMTMVQRQDLVSTRDLNNNVCRDYLFRLRCSPSAEDLKTLKLVSYNFSVTVMHLIFSYYGSLTTIYVDFPSLYVFRT